MKQWPLIAAIVLLVQIALAQSIKPDTYVTPSVKIGNQIWMTENLAVDQFRNGDKIPQAKTEAEWEEAFYDGKPAWCYYEHDAGNETTYGKLYNWYAVNDARGLAPQGWHVPTKAEFNELINGLGGTEEAGKKLKSTTYWKTSGCGTNSSGFKGMPAGARLDDSGTFEYLTEAAYWWTATASEEHRAGYIALRDHNCIEMLVRDRIQGSALSVRCIKD